MQVTFNPSITNNRSKNKKQTPAFGASTYWPLPSVAELKKPWGIDAIHINSGYMAEKINPDELLQRIAEARGTFVEKVLRNVAKTKGLQVPNS